MSDSLVRLCRRQGPRSTVRGIFKTAYAAHGNLIVWADILAMVIYVSGGSDRQGRHPDLRSQRHRGALVAACTVAAVSCCSSARRT